MEKAKKLWIILTVLAAVTAALMLWTVRLRRPFRDLQPSDIVCAQVFLQPPGETVTVTDHKALAKHLQKVVLYQKDDSYAEVAGQTVRFTLTLTDGTKTECIACAPFFILDGVGYRAGDKPCEALAQYANRLLDQAGQAQEKQLADVG